MKVRGAPGLPAPALAGAAVLLGALVLVGGSFALGSAVQAFIVLGGLMAVVGAGYLVLISDPAWWISAGVALSIFSGRWTNIGFPDAAAPDRLLLAVGLASLLARSVAQWRRGSFELRAVHLLLAISLAWVVASALSAGTLFTPRGLFGIVDRYGLIPYLLFTVAPLAFATRRQRNILLVVLAATGSYLGITAVLETLGLNGLIFPRYITDPNVGLHPERARGPFAEGVGNGVALYGCAVAACVAAATWRGLDKRLFALGIAGLCGLSVLFTLTRSVWLGAVVATIVAMLVAPRLRRYLPAVSLAAVMAVLGALLLVPGLLSLSQERAGNDRSVWDRSNSSYAALRMLAERPLLGHGWDTFREKSPPYFRQRPGYPLTGAGIPVHNVLLSNAVELGLFGALAWGLALLVGVGGAIFRRGPPELYPWRIGLIAFALSWGAAASLGPLGYAWPNAMLWLWAGIVCSWRQPIYWASEDERTEGVPLSRLSAPLRIVTEGQVAYSFDTSAVALDERRLIFMDPEDLLADEDVVVTLWPGDPDFSLTLAGRVSGPTGPGHKEIRLFDSPPAESERLQAIVLEAAGERQPAPGTA